MNLESLLSHWRADSDTGPNFAATQSLPPRPADLRPFPADMPPALAQSLTARGITALFSHQLEAWEAARRGGNVVLATGTASGKTLGYNLPVLAALLENADARALYLFPTKALAQDQFSVIGDQLSVLRPLIPGHSSLTAGVYDGDTPQANRSTIRKNARLLLSNPDMLHTGILPHHTNWEEFFRNLKFVVIDEMHTYRGVFGSHVANVIRRMKRVAAFYGAEPQFMLTSATIGNPADLAERLIEEPVRLVDRDGSARGPRHFVIYNPPIVDASLGLRKSATQELVRLAQELLAADVQTVVFAPSRRSVEIVLKYLTSPPSPLPTEEGRRGEGAVRGYRSGYLPSQRREIEKGLRHGSVRLVVATNALELGIDIGGLEAALLVGYPGTVASARQQAGRAGRGLDPALAILVATPGPLDQFLARHPEFLFERSPEQALVDPDHLLILLNHLRCAMFELPFQKGESFGRLPAERVGEFLEFLANSGEVHASQEKYFWMADVYPAASVSLRSASPEIVVLHAVDENGPRTIGEVDLESALWMVHPRAVYLHEGQQYYVQALDLEHAAAILVQVALDYFTEPQRETSVQVLTTNDQANVSGGERAWGELQVTTQVIGFRKRSWSGGEDLGQEPLDMPRRDLQTTGYWLSISEETVAMLSRDGLWTNAPNDYGPGWAKIRLQVRTRDGFRCQMCGCQENGREHNVHHRLPFRTFRDETGRVNRERANQPDNLVTLCPECHRKAEASVRVRSGLAGLGYALSQLAPLFLMCDLRDLGSHIEPAASPAFDRPSVVLYDMVPAGIGFSQRLFDMHANLMRRALELVRDCPCEDGCPSCVGPSGENGMGGKLETMAILRELVRP